MGNYNSICECGELVAFEMDVDQATGKTVFKTPEVTCPTCATTWKLWTKKPADGGLKIVADPTAKAPTK